MAKANNTKEVDQKWTLLFFDYFVFWVETEHAIKNWIYIEEIESTVSCKIITKPLHSVSSACQKCTRNLRSQKIGSAFFLLYPPTTLVLKVIL